MSHSLAYSEQSQSELRAITLLLDHQLWDDAVTLLKQTLPSVSNYTIVYGAWSHYTAPPPQVTPTHQCALFHRTLLKMAAGNVLPFFLPSLWDLLPDNFR